MGEGLKISLQNIAVYYEETLMHKTQAIIDELFRPLDVKGVRLPNRIVMPPMVTNIAEQDGSINDRVREYYAARAKGGAGLIIVEATYISPEARRFVSNIGIHEDRLISGLRTLTDAVHEAGARIAIQIWHAGRRAQPPITGLAAVAPSSIEGVDPWLPRELTVDGIRKAVEDHARAVRRARDAGFDLAEIHMAHGYLPNQFLSSFSNLRRDDYGGSLENRLRFPLEIMSEIRREVGDDYPIIVRIPADEYMDGGLTLDESRIVSVRLQEAGAAVIHVTGGGPDSPTMGQCGLRKSPAKTPNAFLRHLAAEIKPAVTVPVIAVGRLDDPELAAEVLANGEADLIAIGRGLLTDPEWPHKVAEGRSAEIVVCTGCQGCLHYIYKQLGIQCKRNPMLGKEYMAVPMPGESGYRA